MARVEGGAAVAFGTVFDAHVQRGGAVGGSG